MTLRIALLCLLLAALPAAAGAQQAALLRPDGNGIALLRRPMTVTLDEVPIRDAVRDVAARASLTVAFSGDLPGLDRRVSLRADALPAAAALLRLVEGSGLELRVFPSGQLVLVREATRRGTGTEALPNPGDAFVTGAAAFPTVKLAEVVISPGRFGVERDAVAAPMALSREDMETAPQLGEDVFRMMSRLPGVAASDVSAKFAVRGGANEELLVLLDGLELVEPFHVKDFDGAISIVDGQALGGVDLTTGGFTAEHGDRLTGVFEMHTATPPRGSPRTEVGLSFSNARLLSQGAFAEGKGQWLLSARRGYLDVLLKLIHEDDDLKPRYGDVLAKLQYQLGPSHVVSLHGLYANDRLRYRDAEFSARAGYDNAYGWVNWRAQFGGTLSARTVLSVGDLSWDRQGQLDGTDPDVLVSDRRGFAFAAAKQEWSWEASEQVLAKWGWSVKGMDAEYDYLSLDRVYFLAQDVQRSRVDTTRVAKAPVGRDLGLYGAGRVRPWQTLTLEAGLRFDRHSHTGDQNWSPRLNAAYALGPHTTLRGAWGLFHQSQGIHELQVQDGMSEFQPAERAEHRIVSIEQLFRGTSLRLEAYERRLGPVRARYDNLERFIEPFPEVESDRVLLRAERGDARGIELFAEGSRSERLRWSASYALARIRDVYRSGATAPRELDQRHTLHLGAGYVPSATWRFSAAWQYHSGWPTTALAFRTDTLANGRYAIVGTYGPVYGDRLPNYHRLDARVTRSWTRGASRLSAFLDAYNVYSRHNPHGYEYGVDVHADGGLDVRRTQVSLLPFLPSFGLSWEF